ncbi:MAG: hypothetical protein KJ622_00510 [Alphaproteobacteria bacterium]|nr:hypothetical protein [Alphaproteobacteria bacterium]
MRRKIIAQTANFSIARSLLAGVALLLALPSLARASDDGKTFFSIPLSSTPDQVEQLFRGTKGYTVTRKRSELGDDIQANFESGVSRVLFVDGRIFSIFYDVVGYMPETRLRQIDTYFTKQLGRPAFLKLEKLENFFSATDMKACDASCAKSCPAQASIYACAEGRQCHAACRSALVPAEPTERQDYLFAGVANPDASFAAYWPCSGRAGGKPANLFDQAPTDCLIRLSIQYCKRSKENGATKVSCAYNMLYRDTALERAAKGRKTAMPAQQHSPSKAVESNQSAAQQGNGPRPGSIEYRKALAREKAKLKAVETRKNERDNADQPQKQTGLDPDTFKQNKKIAEGSKRQVGPESHRTSNEEAIKDMLAKQFGVKNMEWAGEVKVDHSIFGLPLSAKPEAALAFLKQRGANNIKATKERRYSIFTADDHGASWRLGFLPDGRLFELHYSSATHPFADRKTIYSGFFNSLGRPVNIDDRRFTVTPQDTTYQRYEAALATCDEITSKVLATCRENGAKSCRIPHKESCAVTHYLFDQPPIDQLAELIFVSSSDERPPVVSWSCIEKAEPVMLNSQARDVTGCALRLWGRGEGRKTFSYSIDYKNVPLHNMSRDPSELELDRIEKEQSQKFEEFKRKMNRKP